MKEPAIFFSFKRDYVDTRVDGFEENGIFDYSMVWGHGVCSPFSFSSIQTRQYEGYGGAYFNGIYI